LRKAAEATNRRGEQDHPIYALFTTPCLNGLHLNTKKGEQYGEIIKRTWLPWAKALVAERADAWNWRADEDEGRAATRTEATDEERAARRIEAMVEQLIGEQNTLEDAP